MYCQKTFLKKCNYVLKQVHISYIVSLTCDSPISRFHIIFIDMGVGRIFTTRSKVDFSSDAQKYFSRGTKSCEVLFCPLETKKTSSFCQNSCRKMSNFKIRGGSRSPPSRRPCSLNEHMQAKVTSLQTTSHLSRKPGSLQHNNHWKNVIYPFLCIGFIIP